MTKGHAAVARKLKFEPQFRQTLVFKWLKRQINYYALIFNSGSFR